MDKRLILQEVLRIIRKHLDTEYKIYLFGSWAKGDALEASDLDIGILGKEKAPWSIMTKISQEIQNIPTLRKVDIVDLNTSDERFRKSALKDAKELDEKLSTISF